jgi:hypothetical protein
MASAGHHASKLIREAPGGFSEAAIRPMPQTCFGIAATDEPDVDLAYLFECSPQ